MIETQTRTIADATYSVTRFPARRALALGARLMRAVAPGIATALGSLKGSGESILDGDLDFDILGLAVQRLLEGLDSAGTVDLVMALLAGTQRNDKPLTPELFDDVYAANFGELGQVLAFVIEVNGGANFLSFPDTGGLLEAARKAGAAFRASSEKRSSPNGQSGDS